MVVVSIHPSISNLLHHLPFLVGLGMCHESANKYKLRTIHYIHSLISFFMILDIRRNLESCKTTTRYTISITEEAAPTAAFVDTK